MIGTLLVHTFKNNSYTAKESLGFIYSKDLANIKIVRTVEIRVFRYQLEGGTLKTSASPLLHVEKRK